MLPGVYPNWLMNTPSVLPEWLGVYLDEIVGETRVVEGLIVDPRGRLLVEGLVIFKRRSVFDTGNIYPIEYEATVTNGAYSITLDANFVYDILVLDRFGETIWNYEAPLNPGVDSITIAEMFLDAGNTPS